MADTADRDRTGTIDSPDPELKQAPGEPGQGEQLPQGDAPDRLDVRTTAGSDVPAPAGLKPPGARPGIKPAGLTPGVSASAGPAPAGSTSSGPAPSGTGPVAARPATGTSPDSSGPATVAMTAQGPGRSAFADQDSFTTDNLTVTMPAEPSGPSGSSPDQPVAGAADWTVQQWPGTAQGQSPVAPQYPYNPQGPPSWAAATPERPELAASPRRRRRLVLWAGGAGVVLIGVYAGAAWAVSGSAPKGTTVAGVPVGGKGHAAIVSALTAASEQQNGKLPVALGSRTAQLELASSGLSVDPQATADKLAGFTLDPVSLWRHVSGGGAQEAVGASGTPLREGALEAQLRGLAGSLTTKPVDASVVFGAGGDPQDDTTSKDSKDMGDHASSQSGGDVTPVVRNGTDGTVLNISRSAAAIRAGWLGGARPVKLPVESTQPAVTTAEARQALEDLAQPAVSGPLTLTIGEVKVPVQPADFAPALAIAPAKDGTLELTVDGEKLTAAVLDASPQLGKAPKDARIELKDGKPHVVPGVQGVTLDPEKLGPAVLPALTSDRRTASVPTAVEQPKFSTDDAKKLGVEKKVSTFSTILTTNALRTENLRVAARTVNGTLVLPGETFSLNDTLGERTAAKGYHQAPAINGGRLVQDYGGGVSQMATTIFNNVFFAGLEDIHHKPHSFYISRYPEGREATVNYPTVDLKWRNDSPYGVLIQANVTNTVNVSFWSTKVWDIEASKGPRTNPRSPSTVYDPKPGCVAQDANGGFDVSVTRIFKKNGDVVRRQTFHTTYIAEDRVVCSAKPKAKPSTIAPD